MKHKAFEELEQYLPGLQPDMPELYQKLAELIKCQALEVCIHREENGDCQTCIPYMMNDALECYLILENCRITGTYLPDCQEKTEAYLTRHEDSVGLVVKQGDENVFTLWFDGIRERLQCYPYHEIGHFWVQGMEQWRQLVYIIGTIYDKYEYLGEQVCTEKEIELLPLMEFAPFRAWSPVKETLDDWYADTMEGVDTMKKMAHLAGEEGFARLLERYKRNPADRLEKRIEKFLAGKKGAKVYQVIHQKVSEASREYPKRDYGKDMDDRISRAREEVTAKLLKKGFTGTYPYFRRGKMQVVAAEEHPFTILEAEDFVFGIQFMVSVSRQETDIPNFGFFRGIGNRGWIEKKLENL